MPPRLVILLGPPACGKGTQARLLEESRGWQAFSTGAAIRRHVAQGTPIGKRCRELMDSAYLLPDDLIMEVVAAELSGAFFGLVLDGFPRTLVQARRFDALRDARNWPLDLVVVFEGDEASLAERVIRRLTCASCGGTFRMGCTGESAPAERVEATGDPCPRCGNPLERRLDDTPEVFHERFEEYRRHTLPLVPYYEECGTPLCRVDSLSGGAAVRAVIEESLSALA